MSSRRSAIVSKLALLLLCAPATLSLSLNAEEAPPTFLLVSLPEVSETAVDVDLNLAAAPASPSLEELASATSGCYPLLRLANGLDLSPSGIYQKAQPPGPDRVRLTPARKLRLAFVNAADPLNIATAAGDAAVSAWTSDKNSAYGTGRMAFAERFGTGMTDELSSEFFQTFVFPSIFGQDPHYHRNVSEGKGRRIRYALLHVFVTRSDSGGKIFNYGEVFGNVAAASLGNVYHLDRAKGVGPTAARIGVSIASDSAWNLFTEFWPDVSKHLNIRMLFLRRLAEHAADPH